MIAFESAASNLVPGDGNGVADIFAWAAGSTLRRVSVAPDGTEANGPSDWPAVSADGRSIVFASSATNLVPGDSNGVSDLFVAGPEIDRLARVSVGLGPAQADGDSLRPSFALNAQLVVFESSATNLVPADTNGNSDIFVRDRRPPQPPPSPTPTPTPTPRPVVKPAIIVSPNPVDFGSVPIGTLGVTQSATILSVGTGPVQVGAVAIGGPNAGDFLLSANPCTGTTLAPGASCALRVLFIGTATGTRTAQLSVASNAGPPELVQLIAAVGVGLLRARPAGRPAGLRHDRDRGGLPGQRAGDPDLVGRDHADAPRAALHRCDRCVHGPGARAAGRHRGAPQAARGGHAVGRPGDARRRPRSWWSPARLCRR